MAGILVGRGSQSRRLVRPDGLPQCLPRGRPPAGDPLPAPGAIGGPAISRATTAAAGPGARRADPGARGSSLRALDRRGPANGLCHSPRPGLLPGLGFDHVPHPAFGRRGPGAASRRPEVRRNAGTIGGHPEQDICRRHSEAVAWLLDRGCPATRPAATFRLRAPRCCGAAKVNPVQAALLLTRWSPPRTGRTAIPPWLGLRLRNRCPQAEAAVKAIVVVVVE